MDYIRDFLEDQYKGNYATYQIYNTLAELKFSPRDLGNPALQKIVSGYLELYGKDLILTFLPHYSGDEFATIKIECWRSNAELIERYDKLSQEAASED